MKVYVLTSCDWDDFHVLSVHPSLKLAEKRIRRILGAEFTRGKYHLEVSAGYVGEEPHEVQTWKTG